MSAINVSEAIHKMALIRGPEICPIFSFGLAAFYGKKWPLLWPTASCLESSNFRVSLYEMSKHLQTKRLDVSSILAWRHSYIVTKLQLRLMVRRHLYIKRETEALWIGEETTVKEKIDVSLTHTEDRYQAFTVEWGP